LDEVVDLGTFADDGLAEAGAVNGAACSNLDVVTALCGLFDTIKSRPAGETAKRLITFVQDRPGHDKRYAIDSTKIESEFGWKPSVSFECGLRCTVDWYLANRTWWEPIINGVYTGTRLGLPTA
jgi:dTDP-glucose 4,6-dehydratase